MIYAICAYLYICGFIIALGALIAVEPGLRNAPRLIQWIALFAALVWPFWPMLLLAFAVRLRFA